MMRVSLPFVLISTLLFHAHRHPVALKPTGDCDPLARPFLGYSFLLPDIVDKNAAYAPFFTRWGDYYDRYYFSRDHQRTENIAEWNERFCELAQPQEADFVVYQVGTNDLVVLRDLAFVREEPEKLPYPFIENRFAATLVYNGCIDAIDYLIFARQCEPYVVLPDDGWRRPQRDTAAMHALITEGIERLLRTSSHFLRMRYAYQVIRLAHYAGDWKRTIDLYNQLMPKIDRRRASIVYYWTLGHLAGALQRLGKTAEAAYRYALIFRYSPSKRISAYRSFGLNGEQDWNAALRLCQNNSERATLYLLQAAKNRPLSVANLRAIYRLEPDNPHLELLLVGMVQELERIFLYTAITRQKKYTAYRLEPRDEAAKRLVALQQFARRVASKGKVARPKLWLAMTGYLELLAGDYSAAKQTFQRTANQLGRHSYDNVLKRQIKVWELLSTLLQIDAKNEQGDLVYFALKDDPLFREVPAFEDFAREFLGERYAASQHPGKAIVIAYGPEALLYNPRLEELDDLIRLAQSDTSAFLSELMPVDTSPMERLAHLLEIKGAYLLGRGQPEAALAILSQIPPTQQLYLDQFSPFKEILDEKVHRPVSDSLVLNRLEIAQKIIEFDQRAKVALATNDPAAAWYLYLVGLAYYNMSYFGYAWNAADFYRSGYNWKRLSRGPVFPLPNTPHGNWENIDVSLALSYFERALAEARNPELKARAAFMAARCQQKQWFCLPNCPYRPGSPHIPALPEAYRGYYQQLKRYEKTKFFERAIQECRWLPYYL